MTHFISLKDRIFTAAALLAAAAMVVMTVGLYGIAPVRAAESQPEKKTLTVSGQARVLASPDIAYITLGVINEDKDAKVAQKANAAAMSKVISAIKASGVKEEDIKTVNYLINPKYDYSEKISNGTIVGYTVNNSVKVTVKDLSKTGAIIDAAADSGVNCSNSISFDLSNYETYYNDALKNAVLAAKKKAGTMANALGVKLKTPLTVSENSSGYSPLRNYASFSASNEAAGAPTAVQAGTLEITANVSIVYEY